VEGEGESPGEDSMVERAGLNAASGSPLKFIGAGLSYSFIPIERSCQVQHIYRNLCGRYYVTPRDHLLTGCHRERMST